MKDVGSKEELQAALNEGHRVLNAMPGADLKGEYFLPSGDSFTLLGGGVGRIGVADPKEVEELRMLSIAIDELRAMLETPEPLREEWCSSLRRAITLVVQEAALALHSFV